MARKTPVFISTVLREQALGALAARTAILVGAARTYSGRVRLPSLDYWTQSSGFTTGEANKLIWGIADASLTTAEIAAHFSTGEASAPSNKPNAENARRPVKVLGGCFPPEANNIATAGRTEGHSKVNLTWEEEVGYTFFVFNISGTALTTGATFTVQVKEYAIQL